MQNQSILFNQSARQSAVKKFSLLLFDSVLYAGGLFCVCLLLAETFPYWTLKLAVIASFTFGISALILARQILAVRENIRLAGEKSVRQSEFRFHTLIKESSDLTGIFTVDGKSLFLSPSLKSILGYSVNASLGICSFDFIHPDDVELIKREYKIASGNPEYVFKNEFRYRHYDGTWRILEGIGRMYKDENDTPVGILHNSRDITERRRAEERLVFEATHDALTGLPNRAQFTEILKDAIEKARTNRDFKFGVLFLDLDRFKVVNDGLGHVNGDKLLVAIAGRLGSGIRPNDILARFGGDEFTILINNIADPNDAIDVAERLQRELAQPFKLDGHEIFTSASVGITLSDAEYRKPEDFLRDSDTAMYRAKASGKARYEIFDRTMHARSMNLLQIENDLRRAVEREEFRVFYQPIIDLETGEVNEFEALVRWQHPEHGLISPNDFIPVAEETGLIVAIDNWVLSESCRQIGEWKRRYSQKSELSVSVNLSTKLLMNPNLPEQVREILKKTNLDPQSLKLEVTETSVMENSEIALQILTELCDFGVRISSDDFGTGYSSLSYLHRFPFDRLKIDRSFVGKMDSDPKSEEIVRTILTLADNLNLETVAEGIETDEQLGRLRELGCRFGQGYLFSKPVEASAAEKLLTQKYENKVLSRAPKVPLQLTGKTFFETAEIQ